MGYPFDRPAKETTFKEFVKNHENMSVQNIRIRHINKVLREQTVDNLSVDAKENESK